MVSRRFIVVALLACLWFALSPFARAQDTTPEPHKGEVQAEGVIQSVRYSDNMLVLLVFRLVYPSGNTKQLDTPEAYTVHFSKATPAAVASDADFPVSIEGLTTRLTATVFGKDPGTAKELKARFVLLEGKNEKELYRLKFAQQGPAVRLLKKDNANSWWEMHTFEGAEARIQPEEGVVKITVQKPGKERWHVQLQQGNVALKEGESYILNFRARADSPRTILVTAQRVNEGFNGIGLESEVTLGKEWKKYTLRFTAKDIAKQNMLPVFQFGDKSGILWLTEVEITPEKLPVSDK
jgi:hypothetical protein